MAVDNAVLDFGKQYYLAVAVGEGVIGGTGPRKLMEQGISDGTFRQNTVLFDWTVLSEAELHEILSGRGLRSMYELNADPARCMEPQVITQRRKLVSVFDSIYGTAQGLAMKIQDPVMRATRLLDLEAANQNVRLAAYHLGLSHIPVSFLDAQMLLTGNPSIPSKDELVAMAGRLSVRFLQEGYEGTSLEEQAKEMRRRVGIVPGEDSVPFFKEVVGQCAALVPSLSGLDTPLEIRVLPLAENENKTGSSEYEGKAKGVLSFRQTSTQIKPSIAAMAAHEVMHFLNALVTEDYFRRSQDYYSAISTMCTSSVMVDEGIAKHGRHVFLPVFRQIFGDADSLFGLLEEHAKLKRAAVHHAHWLAWKGLYIDNEEPEGIRLRIGRLYQRAGLDEESVNRLSPGPVNPLRWNKSIFYTPYYGLGKAEVSTQFSRFPSFGEAYAAYRQIVSEKGGLALPAMGMALDAAGIVKG